MPWWFWVYRAMLPVLALAALPGWLAKTGRRGGLRRELWERAGVYEGPVELEASGRVHVHAVSVGETMLALRLIRAWQRRDGEAKFVLAVGTPTGREVAEAAGLEGVRVVYQPVDFRWAVGRYLERFEPRRLVLVEGEMWPNLMDLCGRRGIEVELVNARMSPRSRGRYERLAKWVRPVFSKLAGVAVQEEADAGVWRMLGVERVERTGSLKFDPGGAAAPASRPEFRAMLEPLAKGRPVVLAASTHEGEERLIGEAARAAGGFFLCVPRHAERRDEVRRTLEEAGWRVVLRTQYFVPEDGGEIALVVDTTGELRDWTAEADVVVIGKSFLGIGGQSPVDAALAKRALVIGPHMENFEPLASRLVTGGGAVRVDADGLAGALVALLADGRRRQHGGDAAALVLAEHAGATERILDFLEVTPG